MIIRANREPQTGEWIAAVPIEYWDDFSSFARGIRLPYLTQETSAKGVIIRIADGLTRRDVEDYLAHFFDGIATVLVEDSEIRS